MALAARVCQRLGQNAPPLWLDAHALASAWTAYEGPRVLLPTVAHLLEVCGGRMEIGEKA